MSESISIDRGARASGLNDRLRRRLKPTKIALAVTVALTVTVVGCETVDPFTRETKVSNTAKGAGLGGLGGAAIGGLISGRKGALIGLGIGLLTGAAVGNYMDEQEAELRRRLEATGVSVTRDGDNIVLNMPGNVTFATGSADISSSFFSVLDSVGIVLKEFEKTYVDIIGHTDSTGALDFNMELSQNRAQSVASYLASREVRRERLYTRGVGPEYPIASNDTPEGRALNRRVEIILVPLT